MVLAELWFLVFAAMLECCDSLLSLFIEACFCASSFFHNLDRRYRPPRELSVGRGNTPIHFLKVSSKAILIQFILVADDLISMF